MKKATYGRGGSSQSDDVFSKTVSSDPYLFDSDDGYDDNEHNRKPASKSKQSVAKRSKVSLL